MRILAIETSCDETAIAVLECDGAETEASFRILGNGLHSQSALHATYGGVFPSLAKRAHADNIVPMLTLALHDANMLVPGTVTLPSACGEFLAREHELQSALSEFLASYARPDIDHIAVTYGPGLEPALWVGVNFARALSLAWNIPLVGINHMEGHFIAGLGAPDTEGVIHVRAAELPILGLLISGGHTELDLMKEWLVYEELGATRDDAVGEAFDKVARMMDLPYPGGPEISRLAEQARSEGIEGGFDLPRPMLTSGDFDFSFSGLKTAVRYALETHGLLGEEEKMRLARAFEDTVTEVLWKKTQRALEVTEAQRLVIGGGVSANKNIARVFQEKCTQDFPHITLSIPERSLTTDNAVMIGMAGYFRARRGETVDPHTLSANGTLSLA